MNIREELYREHSKQVALSIKEYVLNNEAAIEELMDCFFSTEWRLAQRAAYPLGYIGEANPKLIHPYLNAMLQVLDKPHVHNAVKRNSVRIMQFMDLPEHLHGIAADKCFALLNNPDEAIAIRVFGMTVLARLCEQIPQLATEVRLTIEKYMPYGSAGYKSRGRKLINRLLQLEQQSNP